MEKSPDRGARLLSLLRLGSLELDAGERARALEWLARERAEAGARGWMKKALLVASQRLGVTERVDANRTRDDLVERGLASLSEKPTFEYETRALLGTLSEFEIASYPSRLGNDDEGRRAKLRCALLARDEELARSCREIPRHEEVTLTKIVGAKGNPVRSVPLIYVDVAGLPSLGFSDVEGRLPTLGNHPLILDAALAY